MKHNGDFWRWLTGIPSPFLELDNVSVKLVSINLMVGGSCRFNCAYPVQYLSCKHDTADTTIQHGSIKNPAS